MPAKTKFKNVTVNYAGDLEEDMVEALKEAHMEAAEYMAKELKEHARRLLKRTVEPSPRLSGVRPGEVRERKTAKSGKWASIASRPKTGQRLTKAIPRFDTDIKFYNYGKSKRYKGRYMNGAFVTVTGFMSDNNSPTNPHKAWHMLNGGMSYTYPETRVVPMVGSVASGGKYFPRTRANPASGIGGRLGYKGPRSHTVRFRTMKAGDTVSIKPRHFYSIVAVRTKRDLLDKKFKDFTHDVEVIADKL